MVTDGVDSRKGHRYLFPYRFFPSASASTFEHDNGSNRAEYHGIWPGRLHAELNDDSPLQSCNAALGP